MEDELLNNSPPGQAVQHYVPSATGVVDSRSVGASIQNGDNDYYRFVASVNGDIVLTLTNNGGDPSSDSDGNVSLVFEQVDSVGTLIGSPVTVATSGTTGTITIPGVVGGTEYYTRVFGTSAADDANYTLEIANRDREDDGSTNNNRIGTATPLGSVGSFAAGVLNNYTITNGDRDFYQFTIPAGPAQTLNISVVMPAGTGAASGVDGPTNLGLRIRNAAGTILSSSNASSTSAVDTAVLNNASPGVYYVEVYSGSLGQVNRYDMSFVTPVGSLSGFKWNDLNGDGMRQDHEPGMAGVTINLDLGNNSSTDLTDVTDANGFYDFANVPYGTHRLTETVPGGYVQTWPDSASSFQYVFTLDPLNYALDHLDFGNYQGASVSGTKFNDLDADGQAQEGGESGLANWRIFVDYNNNSTWDSGTEPSALTNGSGAYTINGIQAGTYNVREVGQAGWTNSYPASGAYQYTFTSGAIFTGADFGNWTTGTVNGTKFEDLDADGAAREGGEPGLQTWRIYVDYNDNSIWDSGTEPSALTDINGDYSITGVDPGTWAVREVGQAGWTNSYPAGGSHAVTVSSNTPTGGWNFGNWRTATINGTKFNDLDADGQPREGGEGGLQSWRIYVDYNGNSSWDSGTEPSAVTDSNGNYSITGVTPGTWTVREVGQTGWTNSFPAAGGYTQLFASGTTTNGRDFGNWTTGSVSGAKYEDDNANGVVPNAGESGLAGWTIYVDYNDNGALDGNEPSATTDANGLYTITGVLPGNYNLREVLTSGWTQSFPANGGPHAIAMQSNASLTGYNFGNWSPATASGTKFEDLDADGAAREAGEQGLMGWTIYVDYDNNGTRGAGEPFAITDANGAYTITGITPGTWRIREELQAGWFNSYPGTSDANGRYHVNTFDSRDADGPFDFGNWQPATLSGVKFHDLDADGAARENGEPGLAGWTIFVDYNNNGALDANEPSDATDANGDYLIMNITPGTWNVREVPQNGWTNSYPAGGAYNITFLSCDAITNRDFGNWTTSTISGVKYEDMNANGIVGEGGEPGVAGWTIYVDYDNDGVLDAGEPNATTVAGGTYTINGVNPGNWNVREVAQAGWTQSLPSGGNGAPHTVPVSSNSTITGLNFGNWRSATISGTKYRDLDGDGTYPTEAGDTPLNGWTIYVDYDNDGVQDGGEPSATTAGAGTYSITGVQPGTWRVREQTQVGYSNTYPATSDAFGRYHLVTVNSNGSASNVDFLNYEIIAITGTKFDDADNDGAAREAGETGLPGWVIEVYEDVDDDGVFEPNQYIGNVLVATGDDGDAIHAVSTNASGQYDVGGYVGYQVGQRYFIREAPRQGWSQTNPVPNVRSFVFNATSISGQDFGNHSCTTTIDITNGVSAIPVQRVGILTLLVTGGGTFTASKVGGGNFNAYDPNSTNGLFLGTSLGSRTDEFGAGQRVDILVTAADVANGALYNVSLVGATANSHLVVLNAVNIDSSTVALQIYGTECGDFIAVRDDSEDVNLTDAKRLLIGAEVGHLNLGQPIHFEGVQYKAAIINPLFGGNPAISRVEIYTYAGDDIVRVGDDITLQQSLIDLGAGNDMARVGRNKSTVFGGDGQDFLTGNVADDSLYGGDHNDWIYGDNGADRIFGDSGNDLIGGGDGGDPLLRGGDGNDTLSGGRGNDRILGDNGIDTAYRDTFDTLGVSAENVILGPSEVPQVDGVLRNLMDGVWDDYIVIDADDDPIVDTIDELIQSIVGP